MRRHLFAAAVALGLAGCGLVDSNITNFDLFVRDKSFTIDTASWMLAGVDQFVSQDCSAPMQGVCAAAAQNACTSGDCFGSCAADTNTCELQVVVGLWQMVDTSTENPELADIADQPVVDVAIDSIAYQVVENSLDIDTPELTVYAAPSTIMSPGDPEARAIGTIPPVPANTLQGETDIVLTDDGKTILAGYMGDYMTPFNIIVGTTLTIGQGDTVPTGKLSAVVRVRAHAGL